MVVHNITESEFPDAKSLEVMVAMLQRAARHGSAAARVNYKDLMERFGSVMVASAAVMLAQYGYLSYDKDGSARISEQGKDFAKLYLRL